MSEPIQRGGVMDFNIRDLDRYQRLASGREDEDIYDEVRWVSECTSKMVDNYDLLDEGIGAWVSAAQEGDSIDGIKSQDGGMYVGVGEDVDIEIPELDVCGLAMTATFTKNELRGGAYHELDGNEMALTLRGDTLGIGGDTIYGLTHRPLPPGGFMSLYEQSGWRVWLDHYPNCNAFEWLVCGYRRMQPNGAMKFELTGVERFRLERYDATDMKGQMLKDVHGMMDAALSANWHGRS